MLTATVSRVLNRCLKPFGLEVTARRHRVVSGLAHILGSYPPLPDYYQVGIPEEYFIHSGYRSRMDSVFYDDTPCRDEWQDEVYQFAKEVADREGLQAICDIGCGSGFKLVKYFANKRTLGLDLEPTVSTLNRRYPKRTWSRCDFSAVPQFVPDLVICADVIEHLLDPDKLLGFVQALAPRFAVLSTPDRNLLRQGTHNGPPQNTMHIREWSMPEFRAYLEAHFKVLDHFVSNASQCTQCALIGLTDRHIEY